MYLFEIFGTMVVVGAGACVGWYAVEIAARMALDFLRSAVASYRRARGA